MAALTACPNIGRSMSDSISTAALSLRDLSAHTPMMAQYLRIKAEFPDTLVFYRMGDFYEVFYDDARKAQPAARHHPHHARPECGRPGGDGRRAGASLESYLARLIKLGEAVAMAEQVGDVATAKGPVERKVVRVVTPGTVTDSELMAERADTLLLACTASAGGRAPPRTASPGAWPGWACPAAGSA